MGYLCVFIAALPRFDTQCERHFIDLLWWGVAAATLSSALFEFWNRLSPAV